MNNNFLIGDRVAVFPVEQPSRMRTFVNRLVVKVQENQLLLDDGWWYKIPDLQRTYFHHGDRNRKG
jgi:hypothetical protein